MSESNYDGWKVVGFFTYLSLELLYRISPEF